MPLADLMGRGRKRNKEKKVKVIKVCLNAQQQQQPQCHPKRSTNYNLGTFVQTHVSTGPEKLPTWVEFIYQTWQLYKRAISCQTDSTPDSRLDFSESKFFFLLLYQVVPVFDPSQSLILTLYYCISRPNIWQL